MQIANILLSITSTVALILGLFILLSNPQKNENRSLSGFIFSIFIWLIANLATNLSKNPDMALVFARLTLVGPVLFAYFFYIFVALFVDPSKATKKHLIRAAIPGFLVLLATPTSLNIESIGAYGANTKVGSIYTVAVPVILAYMIVALTKLVRYFYKTRDLLKRVQIRYIFVGIVLSLIPGVITNGILPIFGNLSANIYGPNVVIFLAIFMSIAIVKHRLLDVRLIVARLLTYVLLLAAVLLIYGVMIFGIGDLVLPDSKISTIERVFYIVFALLVAISYQPLKRFFDKITNKFFFQDAYDSQSILGEVSDVVVGNIDPKKVQKGALMALSEALRPLYMGFLLISSNGKLREGELVGQHWNIHDPATLRTALGRTGKKIVLYDELEGSHGKLREVLRVEDISVVSPLVTKDETIGYLILGPKKSGNIYNTQDVGLLNIASNELAVALQNAQRFEEIQAFNITLQEKVTEATREVKKTNRKLVALDEAKDEFISMASHQLRTPLTSIKGYLSMMVEGDLGKVNAAQEKALKEAFGSSQRMVYLIADFLNVSRIKTGKFVIETKEVDLPQVVGEEITQLREMAASREITLQYEAPGVFPRVKLDDNKIRQVMMNMVDNAIYYTPSGGMVTIQLYVDARDVVFKVVDTGIGVPKREQHKLFTKFFRAGNARKARPDGTGLGLFMAQKIIVEQGGSIIFESTEGKGSTFGFRFPLAAIKV